MRNTRSGHDICHQCQVCDALLIDLNGQKRMIIVFAFKT